MLFRSVIIVKEQHNALEFLNQSLIQTRADSDNNIPEDCIFIDDSAHSEGSVKDDSPVPVISELVESLIDTKDLIKAKSSFKNDSLLLKFSSTSCLQFKLFQGFFYLKHDPNALVVVKFFMDAFKFVQDYATYRSYFPLMTLKSLIKRLEIKELMDLLIDAGKLRSIFDEVIEMKIKAEGELNEQDSMRLDSIRTTIIENESKWEIGVPYLNNYKRIPKLVSRDPNVIIVSALKDLVLIISYFNKKDSQIFQKAGKCSKFVIIEKQIAALKVIFVIIIV